MSRTPARRVIVSAAEAAGPVPPASQFRSLTGRGVQATVNGHQVGVGGPALLREIDAQVLAKLAARVQPWSDNGAAVLYVLTDDAVAVALALTAARAAARP